MSPTPADLSGWTVIALRSAAQNARLGRAVRADGAAFVGLPALRLQALEAGAELVAALDCPHCIFTSPPAVRFAVRQQPLAGWPGQAFAVGSATAAALRRAGVERVREPERAMSSEGLLALPELAGAPGPVGLVTAPGGRGLLAAALRASGVEVRIAHVYRRGGGRIDRRHRACLAAARGRLALLVTSGEALQRALATLPVESLSRLRSALVVASSERLAKLARAAGFAEVAVARSPRWHDLRAALAEMPSRSPSGSMPSAAPVAPTKTPRD